MKFKFLLVALLCADVLFSCSPQKTESKNGLAFFANFFKEIVPLSNSANILNGVWITEWTNKDGYPVSEFVFINTEQNQSFFCVLNPMGGYEYSPVKTNGNSVNFTAVDPKKNIYVNHLGTYGKDNYNAKLNYRSSSDTLEWAAKLSSSERNYSYTRLTPTQKREWDLFNSTCAQISAQNTKINTNELKIEKLVYNDVNGTVSVLQTSKQPLKHTNYCVFNTVNKTVLSLPVELFSNNEVKFSNLDLLSRADHETLFKSVSISEMSSLVSPTMLAICSAMVKNTREDSVFPNDEPFNFESQTPPNPFPEQDYTMPGENFEQDYTAPGEKTQTYLVCRYSSAYNGSNAGWEWAEYPRWEWEKQKSSCRGLFASNCVSLNGSWTRDDIGIGAIGTMFMMDSSSQLEADFSRACSETNALVGKDDSRYYAQYYVSDSAVSFYHAVWFQKIRNDSQYSLPFNRIVAFGDSLSDNGNLHTASGSLAAAAGYYQGRLSNGPVWIEYVSKKLKVDLYDWAVAGAASDLDDVMDIFKGIPYTLQHELFNFEKTIAEMEVTQDEISKMLFTILIGGNNFGRNIRDNPEDVAQDQADFVEDLIYLGAKHIMFVNLPDVSLAPSFNWDDTRAYNIRIKVMETNRLIDQYLKSYQLNHPDVTFYNINLFKTTDDVVLNSDKYNIKNTTGQCYTGGHFGKYNASDICDNPEDYLFWDELHPATTFACQSADIAINAIFDKHLMPRIPINYDGCVSSYIH